MDQKQQTSESLKQERAGEVSLGRGVGVWVAGRLRTGIIRIGFSQK